MKRVLVSASAAACLAIQMGGAYAACAAPSLIKMKDGACQLNQKTFPCTSAGSILRSMGIEKSCEVHIEVNPQTAFQTLKELLQALNDAGYQKVGFLNPNL